MTLVLGTSAGAFLAAGLTSLSTLPVAHADPAAVGAAVTADQFSDLLTAEGTQADNAVDNFYQGIANFFAPEAMGNAVTADQFSDLLTTEGTQADNAVDNFYQGIANFFAPEAAGSADPDDVSIGADTDFMHATDNLLASFGINDVGFADADNNFEAMVVNIPGTGITDVLTSGTDSSDALTSFGVPADIAGGMANVTVNTFTDTMNPALDPLLSFTIPFTDPLAQLWDFLVANAFFGL